MLNNTTIGVRDQVDLREQLVNEGLIGTITEVQVSWDRVTKLNGILFDLDPLIYRTSTLTPAVPLAPSEFFQTVALPWIQGHPVLSACEARCSGTGVHLLLWLTDPVIITCEEERRRWTAVVKVIQSSLPIDPDQPHITAVTRPLGSVNSKNGTDVTLLREGGTVSQEEVLGLFQEMRDSSFSTVMNILAGTTALEPCPVCNKAGSKLTALDRVGRCYGSCGNVGLDQLCDVIFAPRGSTNGKEVVDAARQ